MIRMAEPSDRQAFIDLWNLCFDDSPRFTQWFFDNRFFPDYSACIETDGALVSAMQSMPLPLRIRGESLPGAIVVGVCTHPDHRGHHYMKDMFAYYMQEMRKKGVLAVTYKPENIRTYFSLGHYAVTRTLLASSGSAAVLSPGAANLDAPALPKTSRSGLFSGRLAGRFSRRPAADRPAEIAAIPSLSARDLSECFSLYAAAAPSYSGIVDRNESLFSLKASDYASDGGKVLRCYDADGLSGYCFFYDIEEGVFGEEFFAKNAPAAARLVASLSQLARGKTLRIKLPPDYNKFEESIAGNFPGIACGTFPQNAMGVTDIGEFVRRLHLSRFADEETLRHYAVAVRDPILPQNDATLNLLGEKTQVEPALITGIGCFVQSLCGYRSILEPETGKENPDDANIPFAVLDAEQAKKIDRLLTPAECFIVDEY